MTGLARTSGTRWSVDRTIITHQSSIYAKLGVPSRADLLTALLPGSARCPSIHRCRPPAQVCYHCTASDASGNPLLCAGDTNVGSGPTCMRVSGMRQHASAHFPIPEKRRNCSGSRLTKQGTIFRPKIGRGKRLAARSPWESGWPLHARRSTAWICAGQGPFGIAAPSAQG